MTPLITHFVNYYGQQERLLEICSEWDHFPDGFTTMIVDDGHERAAIGRLGHPNRLVRIKEDINCNFSGTINLAFALAETPWVMHTDMDMRVSPENAQKVLDLISIQPQVADDLVFFFSSKSAAEPDDYPNATNFMCRVGTFWKLGGFDEDLSGHYGHHDTCFYRRAEKFGQIHRPSFAFEHVPSGASNIVRDVTRNQALFDAMNLTKVCKNPLRFSFEVLR